MTRSAAGKARALACVLLAAGSSSRLGRPKQLVRHRGRPLLLRAVAAARGALPDAPVIVVIGAYALRVRAVLQHLRFGARVVSNSRWQEGMATSLGVGLAAVPRTARAALVLLIDQPHVGTLEIARLLRAWRRRPGLAAAARYDNRLGVPAVLPRRRWRALKALRGDHGARALLRGGEPLTLVDMPEAALDIDTPADLLALRAGASGSVATLAATPTRHVAPLA